MPSALSAPVISPVHLAYAVTHDAPQPDRLAQGLKHIEELRGNKVEFAIEPRTESQLKISEAALKKESAILEQFPGVRMLDPAALRLLLEQDLARGRPPRLAPFQLNAQESSSWIEITNNVSFQIQENKLPLVQNCAVGVRSNFHSHEMERIYEEFIQRLAEQAFHCAALEAKEKGSWKVEAKATAIAELGDVTIPESAKTIVAKARTSGLFDCVYLLAEAAKWEIRHRVTVQTSLPRDVDPLIVGEANGKLWVLGAFDLSAYERQVWEEFCVRP